MTKLKILFFCLMFAFIIGCDPIGMVSQISPTYQKVHVWVCYGPTVEYVVLIPSNKIDQNEIVKYAEIAGDKYKIRADYLEMFMEKTDLVVYCRIGSFGFMDRYFLPGFEISHAIVRDIVIYLKIED